MIPLPRIMVAPNGARRTKADHPALPVTISEIVDTARACRDAGARGLHAHVRDKKGDHILDAGLYRELLDEMSAALPDMLVQITTEAVGSYTPEEQRALVHEVMPGMVSIALREMLADGPGTATSRFYHWAFEADISVQHILYDQEDIALLEREIGAGRIPREHLQALLVLGRYTEDQQSSPDELPAMFHQLKTVAPTVDWAACAFGISETACLRRAFELGGKARVGFENNFHDSNGNLAPDNAARVAQIAAL